MPSARKVGFSVGVTLLFLLGIARAWTTTSLTIIGRNFKAKRSVSCVQMSGNGNEGGSSSYEEQYNAFSKQNKPKEQKTGPRIIPQPNQVDDSPTKMHLQNAKRAETNRKNSPKRHRDRKAQEELEMAFLDFISCYPTKKGPQMDFMKPPEREQRKERGLYDDTSTSLDFKEFPRHADADLGERAIKDEIATTGGDESSTCNSTSLSAKSNPTDDDKINVAIAKTESILDEIVSFLSHSTPSNISSRADIDSIDIGGDEVISEKPSDDKVISEKPSMSVTEPSVEKNESKTRNLDDRDNVDTVTKGKDNDSESAADIATSNDGATIVDNVMESKANPRDAEANPDDNYFTIEVKVETTFPSGITVEGAKTGWLEFCWSKGGGIVVPTATSTTSSSDYNPSDADGPPASIRFESKKSVVQGPDSTNEAPGRLDIPTGIPSTRELIVPLGLKQELVSSTSTLDEIQMNKIRRDVLTYKTTQRGFFCKDMIEGTHEGRVEFIGASYTSTRMIWTVTFQVEEDKASSPPSAPQKSSTTSAASNVIEFASTTKTAVDDYSKQFMDSNPGLKNMVSKANLWGSWSQFQLKTASQNLIAYLDNSDDSMPVMEHTETLPVGVSPREAMEIWYEYYWKNGGGSLPIVMSPAKSNDKRWNIPSGLEEELVSIEYDHPASESGIVGVDGKITAETEIAKAVYRVNNPNLLTYPVYYNRAEVRFVRDGEGNPTQLFWKAKVKPYRKFLGGGVQFWTKNGISLAAKNLRNYIELKQLERREKQLQAQLERLREQKPSSSTESSNTDSDVEVENNDIPPSGDLKTIRSTLSISSGPLNDFVDESNASTSNSDWNNDTTQKDGKGTLQTQINSSNTGVQNQHGMRTIAIPPRPNDDRGTIPIESHTHAVNGEVDNEFWQ